MAHSIMRSRWLAPVVGLIAGLLVLLLMNLPLLSAWLRLWVTPSAALPANSSTSQNAAATVRTDPRLIIPKINVDAPVVFGMTSTAEVNVQAALEDGVLHYGNSAQPGQIGNMVIVGHSSNNAWSAGSYKFIFALLEKLSPQDTLYVYKDSVQYTYRISEKKVVPPSDVSVLNPTQSPTLTLITCTPVGTDWNRLILTAEQVNPNPAEAAPASQSTAEIQTLPSN